MFKKIEDLVTKTKAFVFHLEKEQHQDIYFATEKRPKRSVSERILNDAKSYSMFRQHLVSAYKGEEFKCINISGEGKKMMEFAKSST